MGHAVRVAGYEVRGTRFGVRGSGYEVRVTRFGAQGAESPRVEKSQSRRAGEGRCQSLEGRDTGCEIWGSDFAGLHRPIFDYQAWNTLEINQIPRQYRHVSFARNGSNPQIHGANANALTPKILELVPCIVIKR